MQIISRIAVVLLAAVATACGSASVAPPTNIALVHDLPSDHPRNPYIAKFTESVGAMSGSGLTVQINPQQQVLAGRESLDAVLSGRANLALVNMSHLEAIEPAAGFMNLPFALNDTTMADGENRDAVLDIQADLVRPHGLELLGYMRGADQLFAFPRNEVAVLEDLSNKRIRVAGSGIYEKIMQQLGAQPVAIPIPRLKEVMSRGEVDGVFTSPGGWSTQVLDLAPHAVQVPGLMYINYALIANGQWLQSLPREHRDILTKAGADFTGQWVRMSDDDVAVVERATTEGGTYRVLGEPEAIRWRERVSGISASFFNQHPSVADALTQHGLMSEQ
jgi:TRAP-type C4-dicarboxylate transport system substrate-binding protein